MTEARSIAEDCIVRFTAHNGESSGRQGYAALVLGLALVHALFDVADALRES